MFTRSGGSLATKYDERRPRRVEVKMLPPPVSTEGHVPPHDLDAEAAVLSALMLDSSQFENVAALQPRHFYAEAHRRIFEAALELRAVGQPVDVVQVGTWLKNHDRIAQIGGMSYLTELLNAAPAVANAHAYGNTIMTHSRLRELAAVAQRVSARCYVDRAEPADIMS